MTLQGKSAAPGTAVGSIYIHNNSYTIPKENLILPGEEQAHLDRYFTVKIQALYELDLIIKKLKDDPKADIFIAHKEIVEDVIINEEIPAKIINEQWPGDRAIYHVYETVLSVLKKTQDPLICERADDFNDVRSLLLRLWYNLKNDRLDNLKEMVIIACRELMPSEAASMDKDMIKAILTEVGGLTSHAAIIAKSYGIPTILGIPNLLDIVKNGQTAAVDACKGTVILDPEESLISEYELKAEAFIKDKNEEKRFFSAQGHTACGQKIDIGLNIANADSDLAAAQYVDSAGVFRTEFLYMGRDTLPSEDEQYEAYKKVLECFKDRPVIIRTLDIGGDKNISCLKLAREENPFLGVRALRFCFKNKDIFITQIKAALRASVYGNLWLMFPMVGSIEDIRKAKEIVKEAEDELLKNGFTPSEYKTGIMIEIPSIALIADIACKETDFASIGSNDFCQYVCAADRMNSETEEYYQQYHPGMLRLFKETIAAFNKEGKPISICGELGADPLAVPLLIGLGLRKISMNASFIAKVKRVISGLTIKDCEELAKKVLSCATAEEVGKKLREFRYS